METVDLFLFRLNLNVKRLPKLYAHDFYLYLFGFFCNAKKYELNVVLACFWEGRR